MSVRLPETLRPGRLQALGAHVLDGGVNFAVFSAHAERIELCLFDTHGTRELRRYALHGPDDDLFHGFLPGFGAGLVYGLRAYGPCVPESGNRFNPHKLLLDPYAREIIGHFRWDDAHYGYTLGHPDGARRMDLRDNAAMALKARVAAPLPALRETRPSVATSDRVVYEVHVKGFSAECEAIPAELRGRYAALAHPAAIQHFKQLGVTTLSLLPVHYALSEAPLVQRGQVNYWGYNTLGFFSADPRFAQQRDPTAVRQEFRSMVDALHAEGLEVVIDVVFNHTAEGNEHGPTLSFRGLDNASWYSLLGDDRSRYENHSHCGNTLLIQHPRVTQFVLDCLRYWASEMGVDGFRFDLATVLGRTRHGFDPQAAFFIALRQDPILAEAILIAEPWDGGPDGYQVGRFPGRFLDWNDRFRDSVRRYWLQTGCTRGEFARRFAGSSDLFHHGTRQPTASVNFIAAHDGFTLADQVRYARKHNQANGEDNRDGRDNEPCANFGIEGDSDDAQISARRAAVQRALLATLLLSQGTPMLLAGDELGNSQQGNNNAYCQDTPLAWLNWSQADVGLQAWVSKVLALRADEPLLRHPHWFVEQPVAADQVALRWRAPNGHEMQVSDWHAADQHALACELWATDPHKPRLLLLFNPDAEARRFLLPEGTWLCILDSATPEAALCPLCESPLSVPAHTLSVLRRVAEGPRP
ncbi:MAG: glycogen debranching protein GlgX [Xanthomonadales bacterium]|jgi:isoamylase|nr:glycogen debranching protein GlgX [Xanthomonadales bacterium]